MTIRRGSLSEGMSDLEPAVLGLLLEDYALAQRREHCSRRDFADGWIALARRLQRDGGLAVKVLQLENLTV